MGGFLLKGFEGSKPRWTNCSDGTQQTPGHFSCSRELVKLQVEADPSSGCQGSPQARQDCPFPSLAGDFYSVRPPGIGGASCHILRSHRQEVFPEI